ncbi:ExeA family protein [Aestuariibacter sp. A3R04]|uniref:ExeA family protein n=1 Tax=Aestuariibacter sp. A3R04 TaxID=2841571 RepID=UPI001C0996D4|nr:AAA family ATPase [Aestuariibacter sp. A3R04]MBU3020632.1 AAA family ATPase [Aestuariibacter sp. A3R04]
MYQKHFGLKELPFSLTPNTQYYFALPPHKQAMEVLTTALNVGEGFIKITGEVGTGKTLLCRKLLKELPAHIQAAYIPNPMLSPDALRRAVAAELGVDLTSGIDQQQFTQLIEQQLLALSSRGKSVVLIIDEAQALPEESLEALRLMTNLETETKKLLQVILFGQPELDEKLAKHTLRQLRQRISFSYQLKPMIAHHIEQYLRHRLAVAGYKGTPIFSAPVCVALAKASTGTARLVNILAHKSLMLAYGEGKSRVTKTHVAYAAADTESAIHPTVLGTSRWLWPLLCLLGGGLIAAVLLLLGGPR